VLALICVGLLAAACGLLARSVGLLGWLEQRTVDARFALRGSTHPSSSVVIVALDTQSYRHLPLPPLPRTLDAELIEHLNRAGARAIAFDFALERPSADARADRELVAALARAPRAVVSVTAIEPGGRTAPLAGRVPFASVGVRPGVTLLALDSDGAVRRFPPGLGGVESFALAAARSLRPALGAVVPRGSLIDYPGPPGTVPALSFLDVLAGHFDASAVRGKLVVVGPTAPVLQDIHRTPVGAAMSGTEIQADAIATALAGFPLRDVSAMTATLLLLGLGLLVPLLAILPRWAFARSAGAGAEALASFAPDTIAVLGVGALAAAGWSLAAQIAFDHGAVLDYADGLFTIALATVAVWVLAEVIERRERRRLRMLFAASAPEVVAQVLHAPSGRARVLTAQSVIAGYRIEEEIGKGGMGVVYCATQLRLQRPVALKLIRPEFAQSSLYRARFERESRLAAAVSHPHVIPVIDAGEDAGLLYLAMQFIAGVDLAGVLKLAGPLDPYDAALLLVQIGEALDAAHAKQLVHRDVKPANIVLRAENPGHALLADFGLAKSFAAGAQDAQLEEWAGTIDYLAPEQFAGGPVDHRADIYALAAVLYHCLTGSVPFPREDAFATLAAHRNAPRPAASELRAELPAAIDLVIARGMAIAPAERPPNAGAFAAQAAAVLGVPVRRAMLAPTDAASIT
jgi:CHASE2 domain-containing sensor protein